MHVFWKTDKREGRSKVLVARWIGADGKRVEEYLPHLKTLREAEEHARDRETQARRQRDGLEVAVRPVLFGDIWDIWWKKSGSRRRSESKHLFKRSLEKHLGKLRDLVLTPVNAGNIADELDQLLADLEAGKEDARPLAAQTLNHLRSGVFRMFEHARDPKIALWHGENPIRWVKKRRVHSAKRETLAAHEVGPVLAAFPEPTLGAPWRWAAAISIFTGARPGEAFGLRKADVDLDEGVLTFRHSWSAPTTKDDEPRTVAIVTSLRVMLEAAIKASPAGSDLVLPQLDGKCFPETTRWLLVDHLRRACAAAGVIAGHLHTCRRCTRRRNKGAAIERVSWKHDDAEQRLCPNECGAKLWSKPIPRNVVFYGLRHTHATLLRRAGVDLGAVAKQLGHSDPALTASTYDHSELADFRPQLERALSLVSSTRGAQEVRELPSEKIEGPASRISPAKPGLRESGRQDLNLRPLAPQGRPVVDASINTQRTEHHGLDVAGTSARPLNAPGAPKALSSTDSGAQEVRGNLPSAVPDFLQACADLAKKALERGDYAKAQELIEKAARVAAVREGVA